MKKYNLPTYKSNFKKTIKKNNKNVDIRLAQCQVVPYLKQNLHPDELNIYF